MVHFQHHAHYHLFHFDTRSIRVHLDLPARPDRPPRPFIFGGLSVKSLYVATKYPVLLHPLTLSP